MSDDNTQDDSEQPVTLESLEARVQVLENRVKHFFGITLIVAFFMALIF